jgi:outer membrane lipoprotein-sorting protein
MAAAAVLLGAFAISSLFPDAMSVRAFAEVVENAVQARTVQVTVVQRLGNQPEIVGKLYMQENWVRFELHDGQSVVVGDLQRQDALYLDPERKLAQKSSIDKRVAKEFANPIDQLRGIKLENANYVGQEYLDKSLAHVYRIEQGVLGFRTSKSEMTVWVDPESGLPMKIVNHDLSAKVRHEVRFEDFVWNQPLSPALFSSEIPTGYEAGTIVLTPPSAGSREPAPPSKVDPTELARGLLSKDRVPRRIVWGPNSTTITATMGDPESVPHQEVKLDELRQWNVATGNLNWATVVGGSSFSLATSQDGKILATINHKELQLRDPNTGNVKQKWSSDKPLSPLAFSPDGKMLAAGISEWGEDHGGVGQEEGGVQLWDIKRLKLVKSIPDDQPTTFVRFSNNGKFIASTPNGGPVKIWNVKSGKLDRIFPYGGKFDFSPDDRFIACMASQPLEGDTPEDVRKRYDVQVYELQTGKLVKTLVSNDHTEESWVLWIEFSPDGRLVAVANWDGTAKLWDVASGKLLNTFAKHKGGVHTIVFAPDGKSVATGDEGRALRLWNLDELTSRR